MFKFQDPVFLILLILLPLFVYYYISRQKGLKIKFPGLPLLKIAVPFDESWKSYLLDILKILTLVLLIIAIARPQIHTKMKEIHSSGIDIMLALDTSGSMQTMDYYTNTENRSRLSIVKSVVKEFIEKRSSDRIGMVVFGTEAFTQCPLTLDHSILINFLNDLKIGMAGESTAIGTAIGIAVKRIKDIPGKSRIIILLTDGQSNAGKISPLTAAEVAKTFGIKIYTIGIGSKMSSQLAMLQQLNDINISQITLDDETLQKIANTTGGRYFKASNTNELKEIYNTINAIERTKVKVKEYGYNIELYYLFLGFAMGTFLLEVLLSNTVLRKLP